MKSIADIYNENAEVTATPANTTGMGNPMPPTETNPGSEPLTGKCKKECKKKKFKKCVKEGLLSGQDNVLNQGNMTIADMCMFHWKYGKSYRYKVYKSVKNGLGGVFKKHFANKAPVIYTSWPADPISKNPDYPHRIKHDHYNIDYLYAIILNTKLPKPIEDYSIYNFKDKYELQNEIEFQLRSYMLDDSRTFRTKERKVPVLTCEIRPNMKGLSMDIYYHQNDIKYESILLCTLDFVTE